MAQDIFFTQLNAIDNLKVMDKRPDIGSVSTKIPDTSSSGNSKVIFYAEILEEKTISDNITWKCRFNAKTQSDGKIYSKQENYDSYYKILVNAKTSIEELLSPLKQQVIHLSESEAETLSSKKVTIDLESLSGTWGGEPFTDKIVILRGGRGFIIYKNGATMNISVSLEYDANNNQEIKIKQVGKSNASFYPALSRETALTAAANAQPIEWHLKTAGDGRLEGTKNTLIKSNSVPETVENGTEKVLWTKK